MKNVKARGIIIGETPYGDSSKILKVFTRDYGIISIMSKGCKKPKSALHEASNKLVYADFNISYKEDGISTLISVDIVNLFKNIVMDYMDIDKKMYSFYIVDLIIQIINQMKIDNDHDDNIYDMLIASLTKIDEGLAPNIIYDIVRLKMLDYLGVKPSLEGCNNCGSKNVITFDSHNYGYICNDCYTNEKIYSKDSIKNLRMLYMVDIDRIKSLEISNLTIEEIEEFLDDYYIENTGIYLKSNKNKEILNKVKGVIS
jgi:DNA repair protein RecO (recombination protein O)